jgi:hypothetical protein
MKLERLQITVFVIITAVVWFAILFCEGVPVGWEYAKPFSIVISILVALSLFMEFAAWRHRWLHGWFVPRPDLRGTWRVELQSSYVRSETGESVPMIVCYMGVKQTLSKLQMHLMTGESQSWLIADHVRPSPSGSGYQVIGVYTNEPKVHLRDARLSEMHQGAIIIESHGPENRPTHLSAKYWTDRKTTGTMEFTDRIKELCSKFADAERAFQQRRAATPLAGAAGGPGRAGSARRTK